MTRTRRAGISGRARRARGAAALATVIALLGWPGATPVAAADAGWYDGGIQYSQVTNCFSIIGGYPYLEYGAGVYTGYYADPTAGIPAVGQVYYVHVVFYGMGSPCAGQYAVPEIDLPNDTALAIDVSHPIVCYGTTGGDWIQDTTSCPTNLGISGWHPGAYTLLPKTGETAWPLPAGAGWDLRVPVVSSSALVNATMNANVWILDGESSPWLTPWQGVYVWDAGTPSVMYASPPVDPIGRTTATTTAFVTSAFQAGTVHYQIGETTAYEFAHETDPLPDTNSSWKVWWDWTGLQPDTVYHYRIWFQATVSGTTYDGGDRTFRTAGAAVEFGASGVASGVAAGTKSSITITARDATGATATGYRGRIHFTSTDLNAVLPADYTFTAGDAGVHTFTSAVALMTMGTHEVRALDKANSLLTGAQTGIVVTTTNPPPSATLTRPAAHTKAATLAYAVAFTEPVIGLTAGDFSRTGTATGCSVGAPTGSGASFSVGVSGCSEGTVILTLKANSVADGLGARGPDAAVTAGTVTIDRTVPTATAPKAALRSGVTQSGAALPVRLTWTGADIGGVGVARYELSKSTDGGSTWTIVSTTLTTTTKDLSVASTGTVRFRVRAIDKAGNIGAWSAGPILTPRLIQEASAAIIYTGAWTTASSASFSGGAARYASVAAASASYTITGRSIAFVTTKASNRGAVKVYVDGSLVTTLDLYSASTAYRSIVWQRTWTSASTHTVKFVVVGTASRPRVDLDVLLVLK